MSDLPVAVVNNDKEASYNGNSMSIGKDMVSNLEQNKSLDFHFVDEEEGKKGLKNGDYYMVVTLPSDLSEKAASILTDHPEQMQIDYQTSSGHSFIASKMSDSAMTQLKQSVSTNVTETYTKALFNKMVDLKDGMSQAASGSEKLTDGANQLVAGSQTLTINLNSLAASSLTFSNGTEQFTKGLSSYVSAVHHVFPTPTLSLYLLFTMSSPLLPCLCICCSPCLPHSYPVSVHLLLCLRSLCISCLP